MNIIFNCQIIINLLIIQVHFRSGVGGDAKVSDTAKEIAKELDQLLGHVKEQTVTLEQCLGQLDQYQQVTTILGLSIYNETNPCFIVVFSGNSASSSTNHQRRATAACGDGTYLFAA